MRMLILAIVTSCAFVVGTTSQAADPPAATDVSSTPAASSCVDVQKLAPNASLQLAFLDAVQPVFDGQRCIIGNPRVVVGDVTSNYYAQEILVRIDGQPVARFADPVLDRLVLRAAQWTAEEMRGRLIAEHAHDVPLSRVAMPTRTLAGTGYVRVNSMPWANVWIDGRDTGLTTPIVKMPLDAGQHTITLKNLRFRCEGSYEIIIAPDRTLPFMKRLDCQE